MSDATDTDRRQALVGVLQDYDERTDKDLHLEGEWRLLLLYWRQEPDVPTEESTLIAGIDAAEDTARVHRGEAYDELADRLETAGCQISRFGGEEGNDAGTD